VDADYKKGKMSYKQNKLNNISSPWDALKPIVYVVIVPTIVIFGIIVLTINKDSKPQANAVNVESVDSSYKLDKTHYSFGSVSQKNGNVETYYNLTNAGASDIYVKKLYTSCMCTQAQIEFSDGSKTALNGMLGHGPDSNLLVGKTIKAGETVKIRAVFDPNAHGPQGIGFIKRNITLETNLKVEPIIQVSFDADVTK